MQRGIAGALRVYLRSPKSFMQMAFESGEGCVPEDAKVEQSAPPTLRSRAHDWIIRTALMCLTLVIAVLCILLLAGALTQSRVSSISVDGVNINVWKLDDIRKQWSDLRDQLHAKTIELNKVHQIQSDLDATNSSFVSNYSAQRTAIDAALGAYVDFVGQFDKPHADAIGDAEHNSPVERLDRIDLYSDKLLAIPELKDRTHDIVEAGKIYREVDRQRIIRKQTYASSTEGIERLNNDVKNINISLDNLFTINNKSLDAPTRFRVENALFELYSGRGSGYFLNSLIISPPDILALALVVWMGILGSALQMTHALFVDNEMEGAGVYLLRLSVGAITALVIFIVTKAGIPVLADTSRLAGDVPINPFFVSFVAIISGLMSENAIVFVQAQGAKFFAPPSDTETRRWARNDLTAAFKAANRNPEALRRTANVEADQFNAWISGRDAIPGNIQTLIAGVLETPRRDLFTDMPPEGSNEARGGK